MVVDFGLTEYYIDYDAGRRGTGDTSLISPPSIHMMQLLAGCTTNYQPSYLQFCPTNSETELHHLHLCSWLWLFWACKTIEMLISSYRADSRDFVSFLGTPVISPHSASLLIANHRQRPERYQIFGNKCSIEAKSGEECSVMLVLSAARCKARCCHW